MKTKTLDLKLWKFVIEYDEKAKLSDLIDSIISIFFSSFILFVTLAVAIQGRYFESFVFGFIFLVIFKFQLEFSKDPVIKLIIKWFKGRSRDKSS